MSYSIESFGKLLISGEYLILRGAKGLSIPVNFSQTLNVDENTSGYFDWKSYDRNKKIWFSCKFKISDFYNKQNYNNNLLLYDIIKNLNELNPGIISNKKGISFKTYMNFNHKWGLGSSSTLINNLSKWADIEPFSVYWRVTNGSGYDLASCKFEKPIVFQLIKSETPKIESVNFLPEFHKNLYFIYLDKKQSSKSEIENFDKINISSEYISEVSRITEKMIKCSNFLDFQNLVNQHEKILANVLNKKSIKEKLFNDYDGAIKSLGAWGGDFILAVGNDDTTNYFEEKGYQTIFSFKEMLKNI